jgi:photosystem II stability/assembly factor-like uncharacterized protein
MESGKAIVVALTRESFSKAHDGARKMIKKSLKPPHMSFLLAISLAISLLPSAAHAQDSVPQSPSCYAHLTAAKLVSRGAGWAILDQPSAHPADHPEADDDCTDEHLYWTDDDGKSWREITPPDKPTKSLGIQQFANFSDRTRTVFFLDDSHGWIISTNAVMDTDAVHFYLYSTEDGGKHWRTLLMERSAFKLFDDMWPTQAFFADSSHGWIHWHGVPSMNSQINALLATSDGGHTWNRLPDPPGNGPLNFSSARRGWMIGGHSDLMADSPEMDEQLWATRDGGHHWKAVPVTFPSDHPYDVHFSTLKFDARGNGVATAWTSLSGDEQEIFTCITHNHGRSWHISQFKAYEASPSLVDTHVLWTVYHWPRTPNTLRIGEREIAPAVPKELSLVGNLGNVGFTDDSNAWVNYFNGSSRVYGRPGAPFASFELLSSNDGGVTFHMITPPAVAKYPGPPPEIYSLNSRIVRFPPRSPLALPPPPIPSGSSGSGAHILFGPAAGGPVVIRGTGFRQENTVWIGTHPVQVASTDGESLQFLVPLDIPPGTYVAFVENTNGRSNEAELPIRPAEPLTISAVQDGATIHPGQQIVISGSGFLLDDQVWFGSQRVEPEKSALGNGVALVVIVPPSTPSGPCEIYVTNASGKSNVVTATVK